MTDKDNDNRIPKICEEDGCKDEATVECRLYDYDDEEQKELISYYCADHASKNGFCWSCGTFWAGIESFDFNNPSKLCENCLDDLKCELGEYDEDECPDYDYNPYE